MQYLVTLIKNAIIRQCSLKKAQLTKQISLQIY